MLCFEQLEALFEVLGVDLTEKVDNLSQVAQLNSKRLINSNHDTNSADTGNDSI